MRSVTINAYGTQNTHTHTQHTHTDTPLLYTMYSTKTTFPSLPCREGQPMRCQHSQLVNDSRTALLMLSSPLTLWGHGS